MSAGADAGDAGGRPWPLTRRQRDAVRAIQDWIDATGGGPTTAELAAELDLAHKSGAVRVLRCLEERGWIVRLARSPRGIVVLHRLPDDGADYAALHDGAYAVTPAGRAALGCAPAAGGGA